jgi:ParB family chromosome partitioning protein
MKRILITLALLMAVVAVQAQKISYIETTSSWHYVYDEKGKKVYTFSTSQGEVVAYSESFYIVKNGSWYYTCNAKGKGKIAITFKSEEELERIIAMLDKLKA